MKRYVSFSALKACAGIALALSLLGTLGVDSAEAGEMTCPNPIGSTHSMTLASSVWCGATALDVTTAGDVAAARGNGTWASAGGLSIGVNSPGWGYIPLSGSWSISSGFWSNDAGVYNRAIITTSIDGSNPDPDPAAFLFELTPGAKSGTWRIDSQSTSQSQYSVDLDNFSLWGCSADANQSDCGTRIPPNSVPVPGPLGLIGLGLIGMTLVRRRFVA